MFCDKAGCRGGALDEKSAAMPERDMIRSSDCLKGYPEAVIHQLNLVSCLEKYSGITESADAAAITARLQKLALFLKLRGLVWIFFMMCHLDLRDVCLMRDEFIKLPMI